MRHDYKTVPCYKARLGLSSFAACTGPALSNDSGSWFAHARRSITPPTTQKGPRLSVGTPKLHLEWANRHLVVAAKDIFNGCDRAKEPMLLIVGAGREEQRR